MDLISSLQSFLRVAETGSFSAVAAQRGVTQPAISRQVSALEEYLGARLVQRSTQAVTLTEEGRNLLSPAQELVDAAEGLRQMTAKSLLEPVGSVRLALPVSLGLVVSDRIRSLLEQFPKLSVELILRDRPSSLIEAGLDLELRVGAVQDAALTCRRVGSSTSFVVAAPSYLEGRAAPRHPSDLASHDCIVHDRRDGAEGWCFSRAPGDPDADAAGPCVAVRGRFRTDDESAAHRAALNGHGVARLSHLLVEHDLASGRLRRLLPDFQFRRDPIVIAYASRGRLPHRTRAVIDFLVQLLQEDPLLRL